MRRFVLITSLLIVGVLYILRINSIRAQNRNDNYTEKISNIFEKSYNQISDKDLRFWDSTFIELGIKENPFAQTIFFIRLFSNTLKQNSEGYFTYNEIIMNKKSNLRSIAVTTAALMQKFGWDIQLFYNKKECYLGIDFTEDWKIRKGSWVEKNSKRYYLKEFDDHTPVGELKIDNPASKYQSLVVKGLDFKPFPLLNGLPQFKGEPFFKKRLKWRYQDKDYTITISIPQEQTEWTKNLPPSLYGMVSAGLEELKNIGLVDKLKFLVGEMTTEYDRVNFLLKFCQSESVFVYDNKLPIKSVSQQLLDSRNDCDGRSVFLYCLLYTVLDYSLSEIIFISWENHLALGLKPKTINAVELLKKNNAYALDNYYVLDPAYVGDTHWGNKIRTLPDKCEIIAIPKLSLTP